MARQLFFLLLLAFIAIPHDSEADVGPKPSFSIYFDDTLAPDFKAELFECDESTCKDQVPFREFGPQRFDCDHPVRKESHSCFAMGYGFPPFLRMRVRFQDKVYESAPFEPGGDIDASLKDGQLVLTRRWFSRLLCWWCW